MQENLIPETNQEELEVKVEETTTEPIVQQEETNVWSITQEEYNKNIQSASSKAKNELLKEIGIDSVKGIKETLEKGFKLDEVLAELETTKAKKGELELELKQQADKRLLEKFNIPEPSKDLFIKLVNELEGEESREEKALKIKDQLKGIFGLSEVKVGAEKQVEKPKTTKEINKELQRL